MKRGVDYIGVGVGAVIINKDGKLFLSKRGKNVNNETGKWEFPGGGLEFGEKLQDGIVREVREEYGCEIVVKEFLDVSNHIIPDEKQHWVSSTFLCVVKQGEPCIMEPDKCEEIGWFSIEEIEKMDISLVTQDDINALKEKYPQVLPNYYETNL